ncbi:MAG TPA: hypothetical protein VFW96_07920 [Thermomicrobiales bacterium]|nr:hypothetical protein [Thermomicrobiales bacterium]
MVAAEDVTVSSGADRADEPAGMIAGRATPAPVGGGEFAAAYGEPLARALDLSTWRPGEDVAALYDRLEREVADALAQSDAVRAEVRRLVLPRLGRRPDAPPGAGLYAATPSHLALQHSGLLFPGEVEACDGTLAPHDTLALSVTAIGVVLVSYQGDQGTWGHRLFRRDLRLSSGDPVQDTLALLDRRRRRAGFDYEDRRDTLSELGRRGIMAYAERAILLEKSAAAWRMGHGNPAPYELLTGSGSMDLLERALALLARLIDFERFVFVPSAPADRALLTIGDALNPLEYAIVDTAEEAMRRIVERGHYGQRYRRLAEEFVAAYGPRVVRGVFRASAAAPAYLFYAHAERAHEAALLALADAALQEHRGFPMLIDLADRVAGRTFSADATLGLVRAAYAARGQPYRYLTERETR